MFWSTSYAFAILFLEGLTVVRKRPSTDSRVGHRRPGPTPPPAVGGAGQAPPAGRGVERSPRAAIWQLVDFVELVQLGEDHAQVHQAAMFGLVDGVRAHAQFTGNAGHGTFLERYQLERPDGVR